MAHPGRKDRRAARKAESKGRNPDRAARREARRAARNRGRDSGSFSETGFTPADKRPSFVKRAQIAAQGVLDEGKKRRRREALKPTPRRSLKQRIKENAVLVAKGAFNDPVPIGAFGGRATLAGSIFRAGRAKAPGIIQKTAFPIAVTGLVGLFAATAEKNGGQMPHRGAGKPQGQLPGVGGTLPSKDTVVKVWTTGTANFARLLDGRIAVQRKDGTIKTYRPQKHIVIPRNPRVGTLIRADKRLERLTKGLRKVVRTGKR